MSQVTFKDAAHIGIRIGEAFQLVSVTSDQVVLGSRYSRVSSVPVNRTGR